jgi:O-antigen ligase
MENSKINISINIILILIAFCLPLSIAITNILSGLLILLWIFEKNWKYKYQKLKHSKPFWIYSFFILLLGLSLIWSDTLYGNFWYKHENNALIGYFRYYIFGYMIILITITSLKIKYIRYIISAFLSAMFISEIVSWSIFMQFIQYKNIPSSDPSAFMHHSLYSIFLVVTIVLLLYRLKQTNKLFIRIGIYLFLFSAILNLFYNSGRLGQVVLIVILLIWYLLEHGVKIKVLISYIVAIIISLNILYQISPNFHKRLNQSINALNDINNGNYANSSFGIRYNILHISKVLIAHKPILGYGIGADRKNLLDISSNYKQTEFFSQLKHMHNGYLQILVDIGFVGLFLFLLFLVKMPLPKHLHKLLISFIAIYLVGFIGEPLLFVRRTYDLFNLFIGIFIVLSIDYQENRKDKTLEKTT